LAHKCFARKELKRIFCAKMRFSSSLQVNK